MTNTPRFPACSGILFDLDGTLVDSYGAISESLNHALARMGFPAIPEDQVRRMVGHGIEHLVTAASDREHTEEGIRLFRTRYREIFLTRTRLMPGVAETVAALAVRRYRMAVVTNKLAFFSRRILQHFDLLEAIPVVVGPEMVTRPKPDPEMVLSALADIGVPTEQAVMVGDMEIDIETARAASLPCIAVPGGSRTREELTAAKPDLLIDRFEELLDVFPPIGA